MTTKLKIKKAINILELIGADLEVNPAKYDAAAKKLGEVVQLLGNVAVTAQHDETGLMWAGKLLDLPARYHVVNVTWNGEGIKDA